MNLENNNKVKLKSIILTLNTLFLFLIGLSAYSSDVLPVSTESDQSVAIYYDSEIPQVAFAANDIKSELEKKDYEVQTKDLLLLSENEGGKIIILSLSDNRNIVSTLKEYGGNEVDDLGEQAFAIRTTKESELAYWVLGGDATGVMYGGFELAENISFQGYGKVLNIEQSPKIKNRGMKLNLPFDRRITTYAGGWSSESAVEAIPHVWDFTFWKQLIDQQARNRYNLLSIWLCNPFSALVELDDYPNASVPGIEGFDGFVTDLDHEKRVEFWRDVIRYAHDRGMKFYFFNWNIHLDYAEDQYPELTDNPDNEKTIDYMYKSIYALLETYPELDGFGITAGDRMHGESDENTRWTMAGMGKAVIDYLKENPSRKFNLIHRSVKSNPMVWEDIYQPSKSAPNLTMDFETKYSLAHMYSTTSPAWNPHIDKIKEMGQNIWLNLRNDDYFYFNWGDPGFVREYIENIPSKENVAGMFIGSDGYNPSRTYFYKDESLNGQLEVERRWYMEMLWARISYNPEVSDQVFMNMLAKHFPDVSAENLFHAWTLASRSLPKVTELVMDSWRLDFHWYPEACWSDPERRGGFKTIDDFAETNVAKGSDLCNIALSAADSCNGKKSSYELADEIQADATQALSMINTIDSEGDVDLEIAIANIKQMAYLSSYYAHKIRGATYRKAGNIELARDEMGKAYLWWMTYSRSMGSLYKPTSFRNISIEPDWTFADEVVLKEYIDLGGKGIPEGNISCSVKQNFEPKETELVSKWDTLRPIANPDKGWYHHMLDNGVGKYLIQDKNDLINFPGMDHLYLRLAWAFLEPEEGKFDWSYLDDIVEKYVPMGYKISFRITCKETGPVPTSIPYEIDGIGYATPYWVKEAGAKGIDRPEFGPPIWTPDWDDPVFLEKLENFYKVFAKKYDDQSWVRYIDIGSIGEWGEGHTYRSTRIPPTVEEVKTHMDLYLKYFKNTPIIATDALIRVGDAADGSNELLQYAIDNGIGLRDDSPMVIGWMRSHIDTWSVDKPHYYEASCKKQFNVFELEHYGKVKENGLWPEKNGKGIIPEFNVTAKEVFINAMKLIRPTYIGYHGYMGEWLEDNPDLTVELLNLSGYWYFPESVNTNHYKNGELSFEIAWRNKGVAPAYSVYKLRGKLIPDDNQTDTIEFEIEDSGNKNWMPDMVSTEKYTVTLTEKPKGDYWLAIQLFDERTETPVEIGLKNDLKRNDHFILQKITF